MALPVMVLCSQREANVDEHRKTAVREDPAAAAAEQRSANTPTSGPSKAVGP
jgi:hypothetical protein